MFSRLWSLIREPVVRQWSNSSAPYWDAAMKGNAALREAFVRTLEGEVGHQLGVVSGAGFLDIDGFYDNIVWELLMPKGLQLGFPAAILCLE
eukprot:9092921-Pyramimonas_sp.AAC.1